jgi:hypothetical protein
MILGSFSLTWMTTRCWVFAVAWRREEDGDCALVCGREEGAADDCAHAGEERTGIAASEASRRVVKPR